MCCRYSQSYWVQIAPSSILSTLQKARETKLPRLSAKFTVQSISHKEDNLLKEWWVTFLWFAPARWVKVHWKCVTVFYWLHGCYLKTATKIIIILMTSCLLIMHIIQTVYSVFWINRQTFLTLENFRLIVYAYILFSKYFWLCHDRKWFPCTWSSQLCYHRHWQKVHFKWTWDLVFVVWPNNVYRMFKVIWSSCYIIL